MDLHPHLPAAHSGRKSSETLTAIEQIVDLIKILLQLAEVIADHLRLFQEHFNMLVVLWEDYFWHVGVSGICGRVAVPDSLIFI